MALTTELYSDLHVIMFPPAHKIWLGLVKPAISMEVPWKAFSSSIKIHHCAAMQLREHVQHHQVCLYRAGEGRGGEGIEWVGEERGRGGEERGRWREGGRGRWREGGLVEYCSKHVLYILMINLG